MKMSYNSYKDMVLRILQFEKEKGRKPNYVTLNSMKILKAQYEDMISRVDNFIKTKGRNPKYVQIGLGEVQKPSNSNCHQTGRYQWMKQNMYWITCAPSALWETLWEFGQPPSAARLSKLCHTQYGLKGTNPSDILAAMPQIGRDMGLNLTAQEKYFSEYGYQGMAQILDDPNRTLFVHGYCSGWPSYYKKYKGGHYVTPVKICFDSSTVWVADPDRSLITYSFREFEQGMKNCPCKSLIIITKH
ncbi:MAG: hypothetical protein HZC47_08665 [Methanobacterium sp.]|uniref:pseudomurein-binding repeat-containing protein n=1 Tax=Methanobacterium sp. TaxID=2164 RepID=UPI003D65D243|nr:hypothetical protein [Methanobacterium sp.]